MAYSRKIILLSLVFVCVAFFVSLVDYSPQGTGRANPKIINLPVSGWLCKPITSPQAVLDTLETDCTVFADYYQDDKGTVNLYVGYYNTVEKSKMSHAPQVCFTAQGWVMQKNDKVKILLGGEEKTVNRLLLERNGEKTLVYYWYQAGKDVYADLFRLKVALLLKKVSHPKGFSEDNAFVRVSTAARDQQQAALVLQEFAVSLVDSLTGKGKIFK
jgi:EpsI family protein